jgi:DNA-binding transcriptional ArsR family regulator
MAIELELSQTKTMDTITNHGTQTSGNTIFASLSVVKTIEKPAGIADKAKVREEVGYYSVDTELFGEPATEQPKVTVREPPWAIPGPRPVMTNVRVSIEQETNKLDVLSDGIGPALLSVLHAYGPLSASQMLESLEITRGSLTSHLETLARTRLVTVADERYSISNDGKNFLRSLGLTEEDK